MLHIEAAIGDCINVTFIKAKDSGPSRVRTLERINRCPAFLDRTSSPARPSDRCVVKVIASNPNKTIYYVKVMSVIKLGDGKTSLLEKVIQPILWSEGLYTFDTKGTAKGLKIAADHFGNDELGLLELIFDMLELFNLEYDHERNRLDYALIRSTASKIIDKCLSEPTAAAEAYLRLAPTCGTSREIVGKLLAKALALCESKSRSKSSTSDAGLLERTLKAIDKNDSGRDYASGNIAVKTRLLKLSEQCGTRNVSLRLEIARMQLNSKEPSEARALLEPMISESKGDAIGNNGSSSVDVEVAHMMGEAYVLDRDYANAKVWLEKAVVDSDDYSVKQLLADALFALGEFEQAAVMYKRALEKCVNELDNALENY